MLFFQTTRSEYDSSEYCVRRRYNDFLWLRQKLESTNPSHLVPVSILLTISVATVVMFCSLLTFETDDRQRQVWSMKMITSWVYFLLNCQKVSDIAWVEDWDLQTAFISVSGWFSDKSPYWEFSLREKMLVKFIVLWCSGHEENCLNASSVTKINLKVCILMKSTLR
jgi:hypothetical protein